MVSKTDSLADGRTNGPVYIHPIWQTVRICANYAIIMTAPVETAAKAAGVALDRFGGFCFKMIDL